MIQKSASELKSVDFHRQFISGCLFESSGFQSNWTLLPSISGWCVCNKDESQASYVGLLSGLGKQMLEHLL